MKQTDQWLHDNRDALIASLQNLIRFPSAKGPAAPGAPFGTAVRDCLAAALDLARELGLEAHDLDGYIGYAEAGEGAEELGVLAHLDVVSAGEGWRYPPYEAHIENGLLYGRGAMDDKGPAVASLYALAAVKNSGAKFRRRVRILLGCDEESGWGCMEHYAKVQKLPDMAFSPDAEYPLVNSEKGICHLHFASKFPSELRLKAGVKANVVPDKAVAELPLASEQVAPRVHDLPVTCERTAEGCRLTIRGRSAHAATPEQGDNALQALLALLSRLPLSGKDGEIIKLLNRCFGRELHGESLGVDVNDISGRTTCNVAMLDWNENGINDLCLDLRLPLSLDIEETEGKIAAALAPGGFVLTDSHKQPGHAVAAESELVQKLLAVYKARTGEADPQPLAVGGGTYARCIPNAVAFGCERPGLDNRIHQVDEFIPLDNLIDDACMIADAMLALACEK